MSSKTGMAYNDKEKEKVYEVVKEGKGVSVAIVQYKADMIYGRAYAYLEMLVKEGRVTKMGRHKGIRYYPIGFDRRDVENPNDNVPIVVKRTLKPQKETKVEVAQPNAAEIPDNIWTVEPEGPDDDDSIGEPIPVEPATAQSVNIERVMDAIRIIKTIPTTGTNADKYVQAISEELDRALRTAVHPCPFCGARPELMELDGKYRVECSCGAMFAHNKGVMSATETLIAYNRRATA